MQSSCVHLGSFLTSVGIHRPGHQTTRALPVERHLLPGLMRIAEPASAPTRAAWIGSRGGERTMAGGLPETAPAHPIWAHLPSRCLCRLARRRLFANPEGPSIIMQI